jgi:hypothetical protein
VASERERMRPINVPRVLALCSALALLGCSHTYSFELQTGEAMTEPVAIRLSRQALKQDGLDIAGFEPVPYQHGPEVFARNTLGSNDGYVLWHRKGSAQVWNYMVHLDWEGREVACTVSKGD